MRLTRKRLVRFLGFSQRNASKQYIADVYQKLMYFEDIDEDPKRLAKKVKALGIIKEKGIDTETFSKFGTYADYLLLCMESEVFLNLYGGYTEDEFDLVKEELE